MHLPQACGGLKNLTVLLLVPFPVDNHTYIRKKRKKTSTIFAFFEESHKTRQSDPHIFACASFCAHCYITREYFIKTKLHKRCTTLKVVVCGRAYFTGRNIEDSILGKPILLKYLFIGAFILVEFSPSSCLKSVFFSSLTLGFIWKIDPSCMCRSPLFRLLILPPFHLYKGILFT